MPRFWGEDICFLARRERDSNPRTCDSQRFSRPPHSTALPSLRGKSKVFHFRNKKFLKVRITNESTPGISCIKSP